ncbi:hypothetical protein VN0858_04550 [Helicobacter pylori]
MAYKPSKKKLQTLREEPNLFSILDDGNVINTSSIIKNNDNNNPNLSIADLELEQQNLGEQNGKERTNRADEPNRTRAGIPQEIHRRSEPRGLQEGVERSSDEDLSHQDSSLFIEPRKQGGTR